MIRDARHALLTPLMHRYVSWRLRRTFRGVWVSGALPATTEPLLLYANHSNFWDGLLLHALAYEAGREGYAVMEEQNLARHRALTRLGAFSIRRGNRASALETLRHAATVLKRPSASLLIFPQGKIEPSAAPLKFERGLEVLARMAKVRAVPIALRYAFFEHEFPDVLVATSEPHAVTSLADCEQRLTALLKKLEGVERPETLAPLLQGRRSIAQQSLNHFTEGKHLV